MQTVTIKYPQGQYTAEVSTETALKIMEVIEGVSKPVKSASHDSMGVAYGSSTTRKTYKKHNAFKHYSDLEIETIISLWNAGRKVKLIAKALKRTDYAVGLKIHKLQALGTIKKRGTRNNKPVVTMPTAHDEKYAGAATTNRDEIDRATDLFEV